MWEQPIYDRTEADAEYANANRDSPTENKGARSHWTLNRIAGNMRYARDLLIDAGYIVPLMTSRDDWTKDDFPRESDIAKFKADIAVLRNLAPPISPPVPDLPYTHYEKINNIERILFDIWQAIEWAGMVSYDAGAFYAHSGAGWYFGKAKTIPLPDYPAIITDNLPIGMVGDFYDFQIEVISASLLGVDFEIISGELPEGLALSDDGVIRGRPIFAGTRDFTLKATNIAGSSEKEFQITVETINTALRAGNFANAGMGLYFGG